MWHLYLSTLNLLAFNLTAILTVACSSIRPLPGINNCVGSGNHRSFMTFVIAIFFTLGIHAAMTIYYLAEKGVAQWSASGTVASDGEISSATKNSEHFNSLLVFREALFRVVE